MNDTVFREYDIRGKVGSEFSIDQVYDLTCAIAYFFKLRNADVKTVAVGMDGRVHSPEIKQELCKALSDSGINVVDVGMCTTPAVYFALHTLSVDAGLMITASHNTKEYNGIKICLGTHSVWGKDIQYIKQLYKDRMKIVSCHIGAVQEHNIIVPYVQWLAEHFAHIKNSGISAVIDCGNGAAGTVMPALIQEMRWSHVRLLYADVDGTYPNHEADPTVEVNMRAMKDILATTDAVFGCGLDGDGDRMAAMTKSGFLIPGDQLLALFAHSIINRESDVSVVYDIKSSSGLAEIVHSWGGKAYMSPSGHSIVKEYMQKHGAVLGGELSCHFFFKDRYYGYDDGVYALLRLFELVQESNRTLEELLMLFPCKYNSPEYRVFCDEMRKSAVVQEVYKMFKQRSDVSLITIDGVRVSMDYGWGIIRPSNTQPALSIRFEANTPDALQHIKQEFIKVLQPHLPAINLVCIFNE